MKNLDTTTNEVSFPLANPIDTKKTVNLFIYLVKFLLSVSLQSNHMTKYLSSFTYFAWTGCKNNLYFSVLMKFFAVLKIQAGLDTLIMLSEHLYSELLV